MSIKLLDCTLRDGGYLNDWNFGYNSMLNITKRLIKSNVDIIEVGFLDDKHNFDINRSINPSTDCFDKIYKDLDKKNTRIAAMINFGTCSIENIAPKSESKIDIIRVIFKKPKIEDVFSFCYQLKEKGYDLFLNPVSITSYSDRDMLDLIDKVNELEPYAMSLVDTYGLLHQEKLFKYFYLLDNNLKSSIRIGYHAHNNFQLAYSNAIRLLDIKTKRNIILDSSLFGMGKSAGNCNTELLANYLNNFYEKHYDIPEILNIIELEILKYKKYTDWGYQLTYYLAASNSCHPNYAKHLEDKNMLRVQEINSILSLIDEEHKLEYNEEYIENLYLDYQAKEFDDKTSCEELKEQLKGKSILLIGPGASVKEEYRTIKDYIDKNNLLTFSINHVNKIFDTDYIFISNNKRYDQFVEKLETLNNNSKLITTSNISPNNNSSNYVINYANLISRELSVGQSSLFMVINLLKKLEVKEIVLAGFDGFNKLTQPYYDTELQFRQEVQNGNEITNAIVEQIENFKKEVKIIFITKSNYQKGLSNE
ncbi:MAG: hypothetical protein E7Z91_02595 [Cyanobacteria bacterium SIG30]|nr:hypothetical protein [Cyanobacteria bacterium SIG30]